MEFREQLEVDWLEHVKSEVEKHKDATPQKQEEICQHICAAFDEEAAAKARQLFAEVRKQEGPKVSFSAEQAIEDDEAPVLNKASPYDSAKEYVRRNCVQDGVLSTYYWQDGFWEWDGCCYVKVSVEEISGEIWRFLDGARSGRGGNETERFRPKPADVEGVVKALKGGLFLNSDPPCWLDGRPGANDILVFKNWLLNIKTGELLPLTPKLWTHHALNFEYDPRAECPAWERFLSEVFEGDPESRDCIEEQLGLGMTEDIRFHKGFLWIGTKGREGKGTIASILKKLCGSTAYASLNMSTWLKGDFPLQALLHKKVGVFPDVRLKEEKWYGQSLDKGGLEHGPKGMLLQITGGDDQTVPLKYNPVPWYGALPMKIFVISNEIPRLNDPILVDRFITIAFNVSFRGREDLDLRSKLEAELPGIANRCLAAYRRLRQREKFIQPKSGLKLAIDVAAKSNPYQAFIQERFVFDPAGSVQPTVLFFNFQDWCRENGHVDLSKRVTTPSHLSRALRKTVPEFGSIAPFRSGSEPRLYLGLRFKTKAELEDEPVVVQFKPPAVRKRTVEPVRKFPRRF